MLVFLQLYKMYCRCVVVTHICSLNGFFFFWPLYPHSPSPGFWERISQMKSEGRKQLSENGHQLLQKLFHKQKNKVMHFKLATLSFNCSWEIMIILPFPENNVCHGSERIKWSAQRISKCWKWPWFLFITPCFWGFYMFF